MPVYNPHAIEPKWQQHWEQNKTFRASEDPQKPKLYVLDMFPYPSGEGLHVGHPEGYTATDMWCRYKRMRGYNVLHPMGYDAFGLPAEQYAIQTGTHPRITTERNIANIRRQIKRLGFSYDWDREFATTDLDYVRWTQWIFLLLYDTWFDAAYSWVDPRGQQQRGKGRPIAELPIPPEVRAHGETAVRRYQDSYRLAYQAETPVNWCPALGTVLADEEVINGRSERGDHPVQRLPLRQWMLRITAYADRLVQDLDTLQWPQPIKDMQRNWVGRSEGAEVDFFIEGSSGGAAAHTDPDPRGFQLWLQHRAQPGFPADPGTDSIRVYTTRPDTLFGATYMVLAPEHPLVERLTAPDRRSDVDAYCQRVASMSEEDRIAGRGEKSGVFTGGYATNPVNGERIPVWIADYVLISYGTGAIMAVPAHDQRDFEFAQRFKLPIRAVVMPPREWLENFNVFDFKERVGEADSPAIPSQPPGPERSSAMVTIEQLKELLASHSGEVDLLSKLRDRLPAIYARFPAFFEQAFTEEGIVLNSERFDGLTSAAFKQRITAWLAERGMGRACVKYKLRDWLFSRQRYWGEPFPILHEVDEHGNPTGLNRPVPEDQLPVQLPELEDFRPSGRPEPPLEKATDWVWLRDAESAAFATASGTKLRLRRETNTMPQWAGSCWYYLRFCDPSNVQRAWDPEKERYWMPVDLYVGGAEHAVLHLLYSRFWHKVLFDRGYVSTLEPFERLVNQGMILSITYRTAEGRIVPYSSIRFGDGKAVHSESGEELRGDTEKMSKARGNVVPVDMPVNQYGADTTRLYEMFMGPLEATKPWSMQGVEGISRFLNRAWRMIIDEDAESLQLNPALCETAPTQEEQRVLHKTIQVVTEDLEGLRFNTAISRLMEFVNFFTAQPSRPLACMESFVLLLAPLAPHIAEELWSALGHSQSLAYAPWPTYDPAMTRDDVIELPVQINGKVRSRIQVSAEATPAQIEQAALADAKVQGLLGGKTPRRVIVVPRKLVNLVIA